LKKNLKSVWDDIRVLGEGYLFNEERFGNHPAQTSFKATKRIIEYFTEENDLVLDCFMGVGTTALACKQLDREFIGIELNSEYIKIAEARIKPYLEQTKLNSGGENGNL
jgi:DNA modification methylase